MRGRRRPPRTRKRQKKPAAERRAPPSTRPAPFSKQIHTRTRPASIFSWYFLRASTLIAILSLSVTSSQLTDLGRCPAVCPVGSLGKNSIRIYYRPRRPWAAALCGRLLFSTSPSLPSMSAVANKLLTLVLLVEDGTRVLLGWCGVPHAHTVCEFVISALQFCWATPQG